jgi:hypothetical protein
MGSEMRALTGSVPDARPPWILNFAGMAASRLDEQRAIK